jgi:hypothetical protein
MRWLLVWMMAGCAVEDVVVLRDTAQDDAQVDETPAPDRPQVGDEAPNEPSDGDDPSVVMAPSGIDRGRSTLVFLTVQAGELDLNDAVAIALYGEPDVELQTWSASADEIVLSLRAEDSSPPGEVTVVIELADGVILRPDDTLEVR